MSPSFVMESNMSMMSPSYSNISVEGLVGRGSRHTSVGLCDLAWKNLLRVKLRMYLFKSLNKRKGLGLLIGAKLRPLLSRLMSAGESSRDDRLKIFTVCGASVYLFRDFFRPPLQPLR